MFIQLTTAAPPFRGNKILINSEFIISVYIDEVRWVKRESDSTPDDVEIETATCISSSGVNGLFFVQESVEEIYALVNTKN